MALLQCKLIYNNIRPKFTFKGLNPDYKYHGMTRDEIKDLWDSIAKEACDYGTICHAFGESCFYWYAGEDEKMLNYLYMTHDSITMYELDDDYNYFFYIMPPSTRYLKRFDLTYVVPKGIVLSYPINNVVPKFVPAPQVLDAFKNYEHQLKNIGVKYAGDLNQKVIEGNIEDFIHTNEILYDRNMENIANMVHKNRNIKAIFISGPSSSGKTTTSKKLAMYLKSVGIDSLVLSTDDYFVNREDSPRKADGSYEFEIVDALDINLFSKQLRQLLKGESVVIPSYNYCWN